MFSRLSVIVSVLGVWALLSCGAESLAFPTVTTFKDRTLRSDSSSSTALYSSPSEEETTIAATAATGADSEATTNYLETPPTVNDPPSREITAREMMQAMGTSPRRILVSALGGASIALLGNLFGVTSALLTLVDEEAVESTGLDTYFPRGDYKRVRTADYTFVIPKEWVADTAVELAKAQRNTLPLDYNMRQRASSTLPDSAFGPPGRLDNRGVSQGDTNVSVIKSTVSPTFSLRDTMVTPEQGAQFLLDKSIAPTGSDRTATLINASEKDGVYRFEYRVDRGERGPPLQSIAVLAQTPKRTLLTLTVVAPEKDWSSDGGKLETKLRKIAESFHLRQ